MRKTCNYMRQIIPSKYLKLKFDQMKEKKKGVMRPIVSSKYLRLRFDQIKEKKNVVLETEVGLEHFAAIGGITKEEYLSRMVFALKSGDLEVVIKPEAMEDFCNSTPENKNIVISFRLSLNRVCDTMLYCSCMRKGKQILLSEIVPGIDGIFPSEFKDMSKNNFEFAFCDMKCSIY